MITIILYISVMESAKKKKANSSRLYLQYHFCLEKVILEVILLAILTVVG